MGQTLGAPLKETIGSPHDGCPCFGLDPSGFGGKFQVNWRPLQVLSHTTLRQVAGVAVAYLLMKRPLGPHNIAPYV